MIKAENNKLIAQTYLAKLIKISHSSAINYNEIADTEKKILAYIKSGNSNYEDYKESYNNFREEKKQKIINDSQDIPITPEFLNHRLLKKWDGLEFGTGKERQAFSEWVKDKDKDKEKKEIFAGVSAMLANELSDLGIKRSTKVSKFFTKFRIASGSGVAVLVSITCAALLIGATLAVGWPLLAVIGIGAGAYVLNMAMFKGDLMKTFNEIASGRIFKICNDNDSGKVKAAKYGFVVGFSISCLALAIISVVASWPGLVALVGFTAALGPAAPVVIAAVLTVLTLTAIAINTYRAIVDLIRAGLIDKIKNYFKKMFRVEEKDKLSGKELAKHMVKYVVDMLLMLTVGIAIAVISSIVIELFWKGATANFLHKWCKISAKISECVAKVLVGVASLARFLFVIKTNISIYKRVTTKLKNIFGKFREKSRVFRAHLRTRPWRTIRTKLYKVFGWGANIANASGSYLLAASGTPGWLKGINAIEAGSINGNYVDVSLEEPSLPGPGCWMEMQTFTESSHSESEVTEDEVGKQGKVKYSKQDVMNYLIKDLKDLSKYLSEPGENNKYTWQNVVGKWNEFLTSVECKFLKQKIDPISFLYRRQKRSASYSEMLKLFKAQAVNSILSNKQMNIGEKIDELKSLRKMPFINEHRNGRTWLPSLSKKTRTMKKIDEVVKLHGGELTRKQVTTKLKRMLTRCNKTIEKQNKILKIFKEAKKHTSNKNSFKGNVQDATESTYLLEGNKCCVT